MSALLSNLRTDFLVLRGVGGFTVGVIEVKKPDDKNVREETEIFGELFDCMFLKSTYDLETIFGILTRYSDWHVCSLGGFQPPPQPLIQSPIKILQRDIERRLYVS